MLQEQRVNPVSQSSLDRFNESSDTKATLVTEPNDGYRDALQIAIDTPQRPDVFFNWGGGSIRSYVRAGLLEDLTPYLDGDPAFKSRSCHPCWMPVRSMTPTTAFRCIPCNRS